MSYDQFFGGNEFGIVGKKERTTNTSNSTTESAFREKFREFETVTSTFVFLRLWEPKNLKIYIRFPIPLRNRKVHFILFFELWERSRKGAMYLTEPFVFC